MSMAYWNKPHFFNLLLKSLHQESQMQTPPRVREIGSKLRCAPWRLHTPCKGSSCYSASSWCSLWKCGSLIQGLQFIKRTQKSKLGKCGKSPDLISLAFIFFKTMCMSQAIKGLLARSGLLSIVHSQSLLNCRCSTLFSQLFYLAWIPKRLTHHLHNLYY